MVCCAPSLQHPSAPAGATFALIAALLCPHATPHLHPCGSCPAFPSCLLLLLLLQPAPTTEAEVFDCIFDYIDRLFAIVRPRKLIYMAIGAWWWCLVCGRRGAVG